MIHEVAGDIRLTRAQAIAHGVAPNDHFDQGLAMSLRQDWPAMVKDFRHYCHVHSPKPGAAWTWSGPEDTHLVALMTQEPAAGHGGHGHPGRASVAHVNHALRALRGEITSHGFKSVALPRIATGVGGLSWDDVRPLVQQHLGDLDIPVYVYSEYKPGEAADEPVA